MPKGSLEHREVMVTLKTGWGEEIVLHSPILLAALGVVTAFRILVRRDRIGFSKTPCCHVGASHTAVRDQTVCCRHRPDNAQGLEPLGASP
jgi:hypothetical protein